MAPAFRLSLSLAALSLVWSTACGAEPRGPASLAELYQASQLQPAVVVSVTAANGEDLAALQGAAKRLALRSSGRRLPSGERRRVRFVERVEDGSPDALRIVCTSTRNKQYASLFAAAGIELRARAGQSVHQQQSEGAETQPNTGNGFKFGKNNYLRADDAVLVTIEDPERPGQPLNLAVGNTAGAALAQLESFEPAWRPAYRTFRQGMPERAGWLDPDGGLDPRRDQEFGRQRAAILAGHRAFGADGLRWKAPSDGDWREWVNSSGLLDELAQVRAQLDELWPKVPAARRGEKDILLTIYAHLEDKRAATGNGLPASVYGAANRVDLVGSDAGRAAAVSAWITAALNARLGPQDPDWVRAALATDLSGRWHSGSLLDWLGHLQRAGLIPSAMELVAGERGGRSPLIVDAARAGLVRYLGQAADGAQLVRSACRQGPSALTELVGDPSFEPGWQAWLSVLGEREQRGERRAELLARPEFLGGLHVVAPNEQAPGYATRACDESLVRARASGASALALTTFGFSEAPDPVHFGQHPARARAFTDAALWHALSQAHTLGLRTYLRAHVQARPATTWSASMPQPGPEALALERSFKAFEQQLLHLALVAELGACDLLGLGSGLQALSVTRRDPHALSGQRQGDSEGSEGSEDSGSAPPTGTTKAPKLAHWSALIEHLRAAFGGALTYSASDVGELQGIDFWDQLDFVGLDLLTSLSRDEDARERLEGRHLVKRLGNLLLKLRLVAELAGRPALVTELGLPATDGSWDDTRWLAGDVDVETQLAGLTAISQAIALEREQKDVLRGLFVWRWTTDPQGGGAADRSWTVQNKPAERVLSELLAP